MLLDLDVSGYLAAVSTLTRNDHIKDTVVVLPRVSSPLTRLLVVASSRQSQTHESDVVSRNCQKNMLAFIRLDAYDSTGSDNLEPRLNPRPYGWRGGVSSQHASVMPARPTSF